MKVIFLGTPDYALPALQSLIESEHEIVLVITQPDRPSGRGQKLKPPPVKKLALKHNLPLAQTESISRDLDLIQQIKDLEPDLGITAAYGQILSQEIIDIPHLGIWNIHASLLPRWRGAAPIHWAIMEGDTETGITIMQTERGLDTGAILSTASLEISAGDTTGSLMIELAEIGAELLLETINNIDSIAPTEQDGSKASYAKKISKEMAQIDWERDSATYLERKLRAFTPFPYLYFENGVKLIEARVVTSPDDSGIIARCAEDSYLELITVQPPSKPKMPAKDWLNGLQTKPIYLAWIC